MKYPKILLCLTLSFLIPVLFLSLSSKSSNQFLPSVEILKSSSKSFEYTSLIILFSSITTGGLSIRTLSISLYISDKSINSLDNNFKHSLS